MPYGAWDDLQSSTQIILRSVTKFKFDCRIDLSPVECIPHCSLAGRRKSSEKMFATCCMLCNGFTSLPYTAVEIFYSFSSRNEKNMENEIHGKFRMPPSPGTMHLLDLMRKLSLIFTKHQQCAESVFDVRKFPRKKSLFQWQFYGCLWHAFGK